MEKLESKIINALDGANVIVHAPDGTILQWSKGCEQLYGWSREEAQGKIVHDLLSTRFPVPLEEIRHHVSSHGTWSGELVHQHSNGTPVFVASRWVQTASASDPGRRAD